MDDDNSTYWIRPVVLTGEQDGWYATEFIATCSTKQIDRIRSLCPIASECSPKYVARNTLLEIRCRISEAVLFRIHQIRNRPTVLVSSCSSWFNFLLYTTTSIFDGQEQTLQCENLWEIHTHLTENGLLLHSLHLKIKEIIKKKPQKEKKHVQQTE